MISPLEAASGECVTGFDRGAAGAGEASMKRARTPPAHPADRLPKPMVLTASVSPGGAAEKAALDHWPTGPARDAQSARPGALASPRPGVRQT